MLIYRNDGRLHCLSKKALKLAGYNNITEFIDEHEDYSELFVKKPGYIYNFENFSWLSFLRNANTEQKKVLITTKDNATYECELELEILFSTETDSETPEFYYQVDFKNLRLSNGRETSDSGENFAADLDLTPPKAKNEAEKVTVDTAPFEKTPTAPIESPELIISEPTEKRLEPTISFDAVAGDDKKEPQERSLSFDTIEEEKPTATKTPEPPASNVQERLDLVDFSFAEEESGEESEGKKTSTQPSEPQTFSLDKAFEEAFEEVVESQNHEEAEVFEPKTPSLDAEAKEEQPNIPHEGSEPLSKTQMPDISKVCGVLGLPETMVKAFIKEFVETYFHDVHEIKMALEAGQTHIIRKEAIKLKGIASNLMMEPLVELLDTIQHVRKKEELARLFDLVDGYMVSLAERYAPKSLSARQAPVTESEETAPVEVEKVEETKELGKAEKEERRWKIEEGDRGETIVFDPAEAASALGLPESLIVEFANDFIQQSREEKVLFETAYAEGDIKRINETAHKLKGVAANLRIEDMRALMEKVQHASTPEEARLPLETYYAKLAALSNMMAKEYA